MDLTPEHNKHIYTAIATSDEDGISPFTKGYSKAVEKTTSYNGGHLSFDHVAGVQLNADGAYAMIESEPTKRHAQVEVDGLYLPKDLRAIAYGLLVHADELEGR